MNDTTSQKYMPMGVRVLAIITAGAFLFTSLGAAPAEASFWEERAAARNRQVQGSSAPVLLAQLPASQPIVFGSALQPALPSVSPKLSALTGTAPLWAQQAVTPFADVRSVREGGAGSLRVFLVMDAHDVYSAQRNVARLLAHLGAQGKMVVGVEGTSGAFDLERHRGLLPGLGQIQLVDHLLKKGFLNGAEAYGLTAERAPVLWGVEDEKLYDANVRAYRGTLGLEAETRGALDALKRETLARQAQVFSEQLQALDREVQAQHEGRGDMGRYVRAVVEGANISVVAPLVGRLGELRDTSKSPDKSGNYKQHGQVKRFMEAKAKEDRLSFPAVEQARAAFIERVSPRLSPYELDSLVRETAAFRAGSMSAREYYRGLVSLALSKGVPVAAYPAFQSYIDYVSLADGIDAAALMDELDSLEGRAYARLAQGESLKLVEWSIDLRLADRAVQHALTPREWDRYEERRGELARLADRAAALGIARAPAEKLQANLPRFAAFFEAAAARNNALLDNAVAEAHRRGAAAVALVTGGFHSPALEKLLIEKNISHMVLTPRIDEVPDSAAGYLGAFAPTRTPLERLLLGDRLFMNPPSATAAAVNGPDHPFHSEVEVLENAELVYGVASASESGEVKNFVELWNSRFQAFGRAVVEFVNGVWEIRQETNKKSILLLATATDGSGALDQAVQKMGGKTVENGQIGHVRYELGGKNITSFAPEFIAAVGFVILYWGSALSPPMYAVGLLGWMILGGISLRAMILGTHHLHELGHALALQGLGGPSVRESLAQYGERLSLKQIVPFSNIFIPGLSPAAEAPLMNAGNLPQGWKTRVTALVGPAVNLVALALLFPLAMAADPVSAQQLLLASAAGFNLWAAITSVHDMQSAVTGLAKFFACGVTGGVTEGPNQGFEVVPTKSIPKTKRSTAYTLYRGVQEVGFGSVGVREVPAGNNETRLEYGFIIGRRVKGIFRRQQGLKMVDKVISTVAKRAKAEGYRGMNRTVKVGHTRLGSNAARRKKGVITTHPFTSHVRTENITYIGDGSLTMDGHEIFWHRPKGNFKVKNTLQQRGVMLAANGDDNHTFVFQQGKKKKFIKNKEDAELTERMAGKENKQKGDTPQIAMRLDRWTTMGSVEDSLALTLSILGFESLAQKKGDAGENIPISDILDRQPTPSLLEGLMGTGVLSDFPKSVAALGNKISNAGTLRDLYAAAGAQTGKASKVWDLEAVIKLERGSDIETLRDELAHQGADILRAAKWFQEMDKGEREKFSRLFADLFLKFFFTADFHSANINHLRRADPTSTFGYETVSLSEPDEVHWGCLRQPYYLWLTRDGKDVQGGSASKAYMGGEFPYRLTMKDGEVAYTKGRKLIISRIDSDEETVFDLDDMESVLKDQRWLDLEKTPYVRGPSGDIVPPESRVSGDFDLIPVMNEKIRKDFEKKDSKNRLTGLAFVKLLLSPRDPGTLDLVIVGLDKSYEAGLLHAEQLRRLSRLTRRPLNIEVVNAAQFTEKNLEDIKDKGFKANTVVLGISSSGQTANTIYVLENLHYAWRGLMEQADSGSALGATAPHFLVSADMDNPFTENVIGQGFHAGDPFLERNFETFPGMDPFHPSEAGTLTHKAAQRLLKEVTVLYAEEAQLPEGASASVRKMVDVGDDLDRRIVGLDANGNEFLKDQQNGEDKVNDIPQQFQVVAKGLNQRFLENLWAAAATPLFIIITLYFHETPASLLLGSWFPNALFVFSNGLPVLALIIGVVGVAVAYWKAEAWTWNPLFQALGVASVLGFGLFAGEVVVVGFDALGQFVGWGQLGSRWGLVPFVLDVSPINLLNISSYLFFPIVFILVLRIIQGRPKWDRFGSRIMVISDFQESVGRYSAGLWQRMVNLRYGWMGLTSVNFSPQGNKPHGEGNNSNVRGTIDGQSISRTDSEGADKNVGILGATPNGPGRAWFLGIGHLPREVAKADAPYDQYISLHMEGDNPAGDDRGMRLLQEALLDAPARETAWIALGVAVAAGLSSLRPFHFATGSTTNEMSVATTQGFPPLSEEIVAEVFGFTLPDRKIDSNDGPGNSKEGTTALDSSSSDEKPEVTVPNNPSAPTASVAGRVSRAEVLALAGILGLSPEGRESMPILKDRIREFLKNHSETSIPGVHEKALLNALAGKIGGATPVRIRLGNGSEDPSVSIAKYRNLRNSGKLRAPESLIVGFTGTEGFIVRLVPLSVENGEQPPVPSTSGTGAPSHRENQSETVGEANTGTEQGGTETSQSHGIDLTGLKALADFLKIHSSELDNARYLKTQIRTQLMNRATADIPAIYVAPLLDALKGDSESYRSRFTYPEGESSESLKLLDLYSNNPIFSKWPTYRVTHEEDVFHLSPTPSEVVSVEGGKGQENPVPSTPQTVSEADPAQSMHEPWGGVNRPREALLELATYLNVEMDEEDSDVMVAEKIVEQLSSVSGETEVPGQYVEGLIAMLSMAQDRSESPIRSFFNDGAPTGYPEGLNTFLSHRAYGQYNWVKYYVTFKNSGGVKTFSIFQNSRAEDGGESVERADPSEEPSAGVVEEPTADQSPAHEEARLSEETNADAPSAVPPATDWSFVRFVAKIVSKSVRALTVIIVCILLTSWGHTFISSVEKVSSEFFGRPQAHEITSGNKGFANRGGIALDGAPRAFVNTKSTGLMAFDRSPAEKNPVIGRVVVRDSVKVMERKGAWVLVESSGKQGWIKGSSVRDLQAGRAEVVRNDTLRKLAPPLRSANLPKGAALAVIGYQGKWAHVAVLDQPNRPAVWVSQEYISAAPAGKEKSPEKPPFRRGHADLSLPLEIAPTQVAGILASLGSPVPVLGQLAKRAGTALVNRTSPGAVLHERLFAGSLREFEAGPKRVAAKELASFVDRGAPEVNPIEKQLVLAMGYGIVAGESWAQGGAPKDRPLYDDYRRTREIINGGKLSPGAGRALTRLARRASGWKANSTPTFAPGALPVINLSEAGQDSALLGEWAVAVARTAQGEPAPVIVARNQKQQRRLLAALDGWRREHAEVALTDEAIGQSQWVYLDALEAGVVVRDGEGNPQTVRLGALLGTVHVDVGSLPEGIDVVTGAGTALTWDRSDVPANIAVRLIVGLLNNLSLTAPLEEAQGALLSARKTLTAA